MLACTVRENAGQMKTHTKHLDHTAASPLHSLIRICAVAGECVIPALLTSLHCSRLLHEDSCIRMVTKLQRALPAVAATGCNPERQIPVITREAHEANASVGRFSRYAQ